MRNSHCNDSFVEALRLMDGRRARDLRPWRQLVRNALHAVPLDSLDDAVDETVQDLMTNLLTLRRRGSAKWFEYLDLPETRLRARLMKRARRLYEERDAGRKERRAVAHAVRKALGAPLPRTRSMPASIRDGSRLSAKRVAQAVAAILSEPDAPRRDPRAITAELVRRFGTTSRPEHFLPDEFTRVRRDIEGRRIAVKMASVLTDDEVALLLSFWRTRSYSGVARDLDFATSTVRDRLVGTFRKLRRIAVPPVVLRYRAFASARSEIHSLGTVLRALDIFCLARGPHD